MTCTNCGEPVLGRPRKRGRRSYCAACNRTAVNIRAAHGTAGRRPTPPEIEERIARYAAIVEAGGRLFEDGPTGRRAA